MWALGHPTALAWVRSQRVRLCSHPDTSQCNVMSVWRRRPFPLAIHSLSRGTFLPLIDAAEGQNFIMHARWNASSVEPWEAGAGFDTAWRKRAKRFIHGAFKPSFNQRLVI
jgi:hypothetical protein